MSNESYLQYLHANSSSRGINYFIRNRIGDEVELDLRDNFTMKTVQIPIRHYNIQNVLCLFDRDSWIQYQAGKDINSGLQCPGCQQRTKFTDYGVDYQLMSILAQRQMCKMDNPQIYVRDKIIYKVATNQYFSLVKQNGKPPTRQAIPGTKPILGIVKKSIEQTQSGLILLPQQLHIQDQLSLTIVKLQQYLLSKKYKAMKGGRTMQQILDSLNNKAGDIMDLAQKYMKLIQLGKQSITQEFVFAFKKIERNGQPASLLIVYYVHLGIWMDFELIDDNKHYVQQEQALYIKDLSNPNCNYIYVIGGKTSQFQQSKQFLRIKIPKDPFSKETQITIERLPSLLQEGYNYMGTVFQDKIYIFYGQKRSVNANNCIVDDLLNCSQVFKDNKWSRLSKQPIPRYDGSFIHVNHQKFGKVLIFYGGVPDRPDGLANCACPQQNFIQIFRCSDECFLGKQSDTFPGLDITYTNVTNPLQTKVLCTPIFSIPYYQDHQLLVSGDYLKENAIGKRQMFTLGLNDLALKLNEVCSMEPPELLLTQYLVMTQAQQQEPFTPIQDQQGAVVYGRYYTIHQQFENAQMKQSKVQLLEINLTNGLFNEIPYKTRDHCINQAQSLLQKLANQQNIELN